MASVSALVQQIKDSGECFEWYPTTPEMLDVIKNDLLKEEHIIASEDNKVTLSVLDVGAGNGSALEHLTTGPRYAIEKSKPLLNAMDKSICVVGTEFEKQTLLDKKVGAVFCNPPYSQFVQWVSRIIKEAYTKHIYFVIPTRWEDSEEIRASLKARGANTEILYTGDFQNAARSARAKIHIVKVTIGSRYDTPDPFKVWFDENFPIKASQTSSSIDAAGGAMERSAQNTIDNSRQLIKDEGLVKTLVTLHEQQLNHLMAQYLKINELDSELLSKMNVSISNVRKALQLEISSLKGKYWSELFDNLTVITDKLTSATRAKLRDKLTTESHVDFTAENAHAVVMWLLKWANEYYDSQLVAVYGDMIDIDNIQQYKSNQRVFDRDEWKYTIQSHRREQIGKAILDYRVVVPEKGGFSSKKPCGLDDKASNFINDLITLASNLGYDITQTTRATDLVWKSGKKHDFQFYNHTTGKHELLFDAKVFGKGTVHVRFNTEFIMKLNVEHGRIKGWVRSPKEANEQFGVDLAFAEACFGSNLQLSHSSVPLLAA